MTAPLAQHAGHWPARRIAAPAAPAPDEVHVWLIDLDACSAPRLLSALDARARARAAALRLNSDRRRFTAAHAALRMILGGALGIPPAHVQVTTMPGGKPLLHPSHGSPLSFSLSHSHGLAAVALASGRQVGVDIELARLGIDREEVARDLFAPAEREALAQLPEHERPAAFYRCWTRREAYAKARGEGLSLDPASFCVPVGEAEGLVRDGGARTWLVRGLGPLPAGCAGAVVAEGLGWHTELRRWSWETPLGR